MRVKIVLISGAVFLLIAAAVAASVVVTTDDGATMRIDPAKFARMTESAIHRTAPHAALNVSIVIGAPEVWQSSTGIVTGRPLPADAVPPPHIAFTERGDLKTFEIVRATYTISNAKGVVLDIVPLVLETGHDSTLTDRLTAMHLAADAIASRVAALGR